MLHCAVRKRLCGHPRLLDRASNKRCPHTPRDGHRSIGFQPVSRPSGLPKSSLFIPSILCDLCDLLCKSFVTRISLRGVIGSRRRKPRPWAMPPAPKPSRLFGGVRWWSYFFFGGGKGFDPLVLRKALFSLPQFYTTFVMSHNGVNLTRFLNSAQE